LTGIDCCLQRGNVAENEDHDDSENHGREEQPVLRLLVEEWGLLKYAQAARARGKEVEELPAEC
jgi:hypothetical protein